MTNDFVKNWTIDSVGILAFDSQDENTITLTKAPGALSDATYLLSNGLLAVPKTKISPNELEGIEPGNWMVVSFEYLTGPGIDPDLESIRVLGRYESA